MELGFIKVGVLDDADDEWEGAFSVVLEGIWQDWDEALVPLERKDKAQQGIDHKSQNRTVLRDQKNFFLKQDVLDDFEYFGRVQKGQKALEALGLLQK